MKSNILRYCFSIKTIVKTIYFNFKYFPCKRAMKFPVIVSKNVILKKTSGSIEIDGPIKFAMLRIGFGEIGIFDKKHEKGIWNVAGKVRIKGRISIGHGVRISVQKNACLTVHPNVNINANTKVICSKEINFGTNCLISWECIIMDTDFHDIILDNKKINYSRPINIGSNVWIGMRSIILKGSNIPEFSIIAAGATISGILKKENCIYGGNSVSIIKENVLWRM